MRRRFRYDRLLAWTLTVVTLLALARIAAGPLAPADPPPYTLVDQIGAQTGAIAGDDHYVYLTVGSRLQVWDMADADAPRLVGEGPVTPWLPGELAVAGARAFALADADGQSGHELLQVHDISEPRSPRPAGRLSTSSQGWYSAVAEGQHAFVMGRGSDDLEVVVASDPDRPAVVAQVGGGSWHLAVRDGLLGQLSTRSGRSPELQLMDVSRPDQPRITGRLTYPPGPHWPLIRLDDVALSGHHAYIAGGVAPSPPAVGVQGTTTFTPTPPDYVSPTPTATPIGWRSPTPLPTATNPPYLRVVDTANHAQPVEVGTLFGGAVNGSFIAARDGVAVVQVVPAEDLRLVDIMTPAAPRELARLPAVLRRRPVLVGDRLVLLEDSPARVRVVDIAAPARPRVGAEWSVAHWAVRDLAARDGWLYVADSRFGLRVLDVHEPDAVREVGQLALPQASMLATAPGQPGFVYVSDHVDTFVVDVHDPAAPRLVSRLRPRANAIRRTSYLNDLTTTGSYLLAAAGTSGLWVADVSDPTRPRELAQLAMPDPTTPDEVNSLAADGTLVVLGNSSERHLYAVDLGEVSRPQLLGSLDVPWDAHVMAIQNGFVFAGSSGQEPGLHTVDARQPEAMQLWGDRRVMDGVAGLAIDGNLAFAGSLSLHVMDLTVAGDPLPIATVVVPFGNFSPIRGRPVALTGDSLFIADDAGGGITVVRRSGELLRPTRTPVPPGYHTTTPSPTPTATRTRTPRPTPRPVEVMARCYLPRLARTYMPTAAAGW